ncbi:Transposase DDE domain protein [Stieleria neptunia]|uniref:Transposase DDE domain protein n=1 Tax=Stieleria neptunia TaxID=2527979 RepID=A0A518I2V4_9BACT|nr:IS4 family transposase [Stieleria neptunia]QDV47440.1 Transposase DDE domain protein [Stieleria neptunia]
MNDQSNDSAFTVQSKVGRASSLVIDLLLPHAKVHEICAEIGHKFNESPYTPMVVVWMFISQVLSKNHNCQQAVIKLNSWRIVQGLKRVSSETTSYCKARLKLPEALFTKLLNWTSQCCEESSNESWLFRGRIVEMVDGWTVTMADTAKNQAEYPQPKSQKPGCGFPMARMIGLFSLVTGAVNSVALGQYSGKQTGETSLLRRVLHRISPGNILLADRYYASFWFLALSKTNGIDLVARAHHRRKIDFRKGLKLGYLDQLIAYHKPARPSWMSKDEYDVIPAIIVVRHLRYKVEQKGFRTREITLATTLLNANVYTAEELADLYRKRWQVELHIRSLKTQMQMEHLRCKSPAMIRKEIHCHMIGYNLVRMAMLASALRFNLLPSQISFTGTMEAIEEFAASLRDQTDHRTALWENLLITVAEITVGDRPGRQEKRELKRRQKNYKLMKTPRDPNRNRYATAA